MVKCTFCGKEEQPFRGVHFIGNDGNVNFYCSSKCRKNALKLKRDKRKFKWTAAYHEEREKTKVKEERKAAKAKESSETQKKEPKK